MYSSQRVSLSNITGVNSLWNNVIARLLHWNYLASLVYFTKDLSSHGIFVITEKNTSKIVAHHTPSRRLRFENFAGFAFRCFFSEVSSPNECSLPVLAGIYTGGHDGWENSESCANIANGKTDRFPINLS